MGVLIRLGQMVCAWAPGNHQAGLNWLDTFNQFA